jgi:hypothetical protein
LLLTQVFRRTFWRVLARWAWVPLFVAAQWVALLHGQVHRQAVSAGHGAEVSADGQVHAHASGWAEFLHTLYAGHDDGDSTCDLMAHIAQADAAALVVWDLPALPATASVAWLVGEAAFRWHARASARGPPARP